MEDSHDPCSALPVKPCSNLIFQMCLSITEELGYCVEAGLHKFLDDLLHLLFMKSVR